MILEPLQRCLLALAGLALIVLVPAEVCLAQKYTLGTLWDAIHDPAPQTTEVGLGGGISYRPEFLGADENEFSALPMVRVRDFYGLHFRPFSLTYDLVRKIDETTGRSYLRAGPSLSVDFGRDEDDSRFLDGLGDVDTGVLVGAFLQAHFGPAFLNLSGEQDIADGHDGALVNAKLGMMIPLSAKVRLIPALTTSWASEDYLQSFLGVTEAQAARSIYSTYSPEAGFKDVGASLNLIVSLTENWGLNATASYKRLVGEAADSPIVEGEGGSKDQWLVMLGIMRTFRF